jgi:hypothetical protein
MRTAVTINMVRLRGLIDNLPAHKVPGVKDAIEAAGATLQY